MGILNRLFGKKTRRPDPEQLLQAIFALIEAETWTESKRIVAQHPELLSDEADELLGQLIIMAQDQEQVEGMLAEHRDLLRRCRELGVESAFSEPTSADMDVASLFRQAQEAEQRYLQTGNPAALDAAVAAWECILNHPAFPASPEPFQLAALNNGGNVYLRRYWAQGRLDDLNRALTALQTAVQRTPPDSPDLPAVLTNLGNGLHARYARTGRLEDLEEAIRAWQDAVQRTPPDSPALPMYLSNLGTGLSDRYARTGRLDDLEEAIRVSQDAVQRTPPDSPDLPAYLNNLGTGLSDRYARTGRLDDLEEIIRVFQGAVQHTPSDSPALPARLNNLGTGLRARYARTGRLDDLEEAAKAYEKACQDGLEIALEVVLGSARNWGTWAAERRAWAESARAYGYGMEAVQRLYRAQLLRAGKEAWLRDAQGLASQAAYALAQNGEAHRALSALESGCARLMAETLERRRGDLQRLPDIGHADLYERYRTAAERIEQIERGASPAEADPAAAIRQARAELDAAVEAIRRVPGYEDLFRSLDSDDIQALAQPGPLVYLSVTPAGGLALVVRPNEVQPVWLDVREDDLNGWLVRYEGQEVAGGYSPAQLGSGALTDELDALLPALGDKVIQPIADALAPPSREAGDPAARPGVTLIPIGRMSLLPLHAACYLRNGRAHAFMDEFTVAYAPSAEAVRTARQQAAARRQAPLHLVGAGNPKTDAPSLAFAKAELAGIAALLAADRTTCYYEADATRDKIWSALPRATIGHFACHGQFNADAPLDSALLLANGTQLTVRDLINAEPERLAQLRLVVLSACQTAITDFSNLPDEAVGLPSSFLQAGVPAVVGTLWPVADISTALLLARFYRYHLQDGLDAAMALHQAQAWLRDSTAAEMNLADWSERCYEASGRTNGDALWWMRYGQANPGEKPFAHPYYWAAFAFSGVGV